MSESLLEHGLKEEKNQNNSNFFHLRRLSWGQIIEAASEFLMCEEEEDDDGGDEGDGHHAARFFFFSPASLKES